MGPGMLFVSWRWSSDYIVGSAPVNRFMSSVLSLSLSLSLTLLVFLSLNSRCRRLADACQDSKGTQEALGGSWVAITGIVSPRK